jgi:hypothetical protein
MFLTFFNQKTLIELCLIDFPRGFFQLKGLQCALKTIIQKAELCLLCQI